MRSLRNIGLLAMLMLAFVFSAFAQEDSKAEETRDSKAPETQESRAMDVQLLGLATELGGQIGDAPTVAAIANYAFTVANGVALEDMTGATQIVASGQDDTVSAVQNLGFDFFFMASGYNRFCASTDGWMRLGNAACSSQITNDLTSTSNTPKIAPYWDDIATGTTGSVSYKVVGSAPNRKMVVQWFVTVPRLTTGAANATFQAWLYEGTGIIQYVYGNGLVTNANNYSVGLSTTAASATGGFASVTTSTDTNSYTTVNNSNTTAITAGKSYVYTPPQTAPSAAPSNITFTNIKPSTVTLNWVDNSVDEDGFPIAISSDGGATYTFIGTAAENTTSINITGLLANTTYFFRVYAATEGLATAPAEGSVTTAPPISGTKTIGPGGDYTTFNAAINDANAGLGAGGVTFNVTAGTTFAENGTCITGGSSTTPIVFQKSGAGANPIIQPPGSTSTQDSGVCIFGGDYITFNGIDVAVAAANTTVEYGYLIFNSSATNGATNNTVQNSNITLNRANTSSIGIAQLFGATATAASGAQSNNRYYNITVQNASRGILLSSSTASFPDSNNEIGVIDGGVTTIGNPAVPNDIGNATTSTLYGIRAINQNAVRIFNTTVQNVTHTSTSSATGIYLDNASTGTLGTSLIFNNKISNISKTTATTVGTVYGIRADVSTGNVATVYNNFITGLNQNSPTTATATIATRGLAANVGGNGGTVNAYFNSVRIDQGTTLGYGSAAFYLAGGSTVTQNNIFSNFTGAQTSTSKHYAYYRSSGTITTSTNNDLYIANSTNGFTGFFTTDRATLADWQAAQPGLDANSIAADPQFVSAADLHVAPTSPVVNAGVAAGGITKDIDGQNRVGNPDIGADEPGGITPPANDIAATAITNPPAGSIFATGATVTPTATFTNVGSTTQTNVSVTFTITGPGGYSYTSTKTIASIAVDQTVTVTFDPTPAFTTAGTYNMTAAVTTPDANAANDTQTGTFQVVVPLSGNVNVGTGEAFTSLTNPGGVFANLNAAGATGNVVINITSDLTAETGAVALNELAGGFTVTIKPSGAARTVSGSSTAGLIKLNGADNVTIDGLLSGGTVRSLTIANTNTGTSSAVIWLASATAANGATNNVVKNTNITGDSTITTLIGIFSGGTTTISATSSTGNALTANSNNTIQNNQISKSQYGIVSRGTSTTTLDQNLQIIGNAIGVAGAGNGFNTRGVSLVNQDTATVRGNEIQNASNSTTTTDMAGIYQTDVKNNIISENKIHSLSYTGTSTGKLYGIHSDSAAFAVSTVPSNNTTVNNSVANLTSTATSTSWNVSGIVNFAGYGDKYYFNSVSLTGQMSAGTGGSAAFSVGTGLSSATNTSGGFDIRNNIFSMTGSSTAAAKLYAHYVRFTTTSPYTATTLDYNDLYVVAGGSAMGHIGFYTGVDRTTLADWKTATGQEANSLSANPLFVSATDLHLQSTSPVINMGTPIAGVTTDFDGETRDAATPDIGADEIVPGTLVLSSGTYSVIENAGTVTITVNRTGGMTGAVSVPYTLTDGTATGGSPCGTGFDYDNAGGTVSFANGETTKTFTVPICDDFVFEGDETFNVTLGTATGGATTGTPATAVVTITDNDAAPTFAIDSISQNEGDTGTTSYVFTVTKSGATSLNATVTYTTADGTAMVTDGDYQANFGTLTFLPADTAITITVLVNGDRRVEPNEAFTVELSNAVNATLSTATGTGTIINDDAAGVIVTPTTVAVTEGGATATYSVVLTSQPTSDVTITITPDAQVTVSPTTLTFTPANWNVPQTVTVTAVDDAIAEPSPHTGTITQTAASGDPNYNNIPVATVTANITDNDTAPGFSINDVTMNEGDTGTTSFVFTVTRSGATGAAASVNYTTVDGTATVANADYAATNGTLNFAIGDATKQITVLVNGDTVVEPTETFTVLLSNATGATITDDTGLGTITNDDIPSVSLSVSSNTGSEAAMTAITVTATATAPVTGNQTVDVTVSGTGITSGDYTLSSATITIPNGQTSGSVTFTVVDDTEVEGTETATLTISNPSAGITIGSPASQNITITDNDAATDLTISQSAPATATAGTAFNYTLTFGNSGTTNATGFNVTFRVPNNVNYNSASGGTACTGSSYDTTTRTVTFTGCAANGGTTNNQVFVNVTPVGGNVTSLGSNVVVDSTNVIAESDESNNTAANATTNVQFSSAINPTIGTGGNYPNVSSFLNSLTVSGGCNVTVVLISNTLETSNVVIPACVTLNVGTFIISDTPGPALSFTLQAGATLITANPQGIALTGNTGSIQVAGVRTYDAGANYVYNGTVPQATGTGLTGANNLTFANTNATDVDVTLTSNVTVTGVLNLTDNIVATGSNVLTLSQSGTYNRTSGFVEGNFSKLFPVTTGGTFEYPVGTVTGADDSYSPLQLSNLNVAVAGNGLTVAAIDSVSPAFGGPPPTVNRISRYWQLTEIGSVVTNMTFAYPTTENTAANFANQADRKLFRGNVSACVGASPCSFGTNGAFTLASITNASEFSPWTVAELSPSAANAIVSGRVTTNAGVAIAKVKLTLTDAQGVERTASTDRTGRFTFTDVPTGQTYILSISSRRFQFAEPTRVITVNENINGIDFIAY